MYICIQTLEEELMHVISVLEESAHCSQPPALPHVASGAYVSIRQHTSAYVSIRQILLQSAQVEGKKKKEKEIEAKMCGKMRRKKLIVCCVSS